MAKQPTNLTGLKKGDTLYYVNTRSYSDDMGVLEATIERVTTTADYVICHMVYSYTYGVHPRKVIQKEKEPALFANRKDVNRRDITEHFYTDEDYARHVYRDWLKDRRAMSIGYNIAGAFNELRKQL